MPHGSDHETAGHQQWCPVFVYSAYADGHLTRIQIAASGRQVRDYTPFPGFL